MNIRVLFVTIIALFTFLNNTKAQSGETGNKKEMAFPFQQVHLAYQLIRYGYQERSALPLITALQVLRTQGTSSNEAIITKVDGSSPIENDSLKNVKLSFDEKQIINDATLFASENANLLSLLKDLQTQTRDALPGLDSPRTVRDRVNAGATDVWKIVLRGGKPVHLFVMGDGDTDLDVFVYDTEGNLVADDSGCDEAGISFTPRWTMTYIIKIKNLGKVYNQYVMSIYQ